MRTKKLLAYSQLMRLDKPIGILLVLWPALWALWIAAEGVPSLQNIVIFSLGAILMRSAGCVINDIADRKIDGHVERTRNRPLITGIVTKKEALILFTILILLAFILVLCTNLLTIMLSLGAVFLAALYPFMKRHTHLPQAFLGAAFAWSIPMAFTAESNQFDPAIVLLYSSVVVWTVSYDTFYAMIDRFDDRKIGVKSTAILFGDNDRIITSCLQGLSIVLLIILGSQKELGVIFYLSLLLASGLFHYQQRLVAQRKKPLYYKAFSNNNWVGCIIFCGIALDFALA